MNAVGLCVMLTGNVKTFSAPNIYIFLFCFTIWASCVMRGRPNVQQIDIQANQDLNLLLLFFS